MKLLDGMLILIMLILIPLMTPQAQPSIATPIPIVQQADAVILPAIFAHLVRDAEMEHVIQQVKTVPIVRQIVEYAL
jgi:hypothetical protein